MLDNSGQITNGGKKPRLAFYKMNDGLNVMCVQGVMEWM
jgi:hypothetical protein